jgi:hypothetical protein
MYLAEELGSGTEVRCRRVPRSPASRRIRRNFHRLRREFGTIAVEICLSCGWSCQACKICDAYSAALRVVGRKASVVR